MHPVTCAPDCDWHEYNGGDDESREGSGDGDDY
jgi:hypothetical protein